MNIKAYRNRYSNYLVIIDQSVFEMSSNANQPNGVNIYLGEVNDLKLDDCNESNAVMIGDLPKGTLLGIIRSLAFDLKLAKESMLLIENAIFNTED
jgi:hypothetical protein